MGPPTSATLIRPDQPLQRLGPYMGPPTSATLIRPDQPLQRLQGPYGNPNQCDPDQA
jgi:hypothetical protein